MTAVLKFRFPAVSTVPPDVVANQSMVVPVAGVTVPDSVKLPGPVLAAPVTVAMVGKVFTVPVMGTEILVAPEELQTILPDTVPVVPAAIRK